MALNRFGHVTAYPIPEPTATMRNDQNKADDTSYDAVYTQDGDWLGQRVIKVRKSATVNADESARILPSKPTLGGSLPLKKRSPTP
jgi:hypothetical protein